jgi:hypothetical protein
MYDPRMNEEDGVGWILLAALVFIIVSVVWGSASFSRAKSECLAQGYTGVVRGAGEWMGWHCVK